MRPLTLGELRTALPALEELKPMLDLLLTTSEPDPADTWARSAEVGTVEDRVVNATGLGGDVEQLAESAREHLAAIYGCVAEAIAKLAGGERSAAARSLLEAAAIEENRDRAARAAAYAESAYRVCAPTRSASLTALALRRWGRALLALGRLDDALARYRASVEMASDAGDPAGAAEAAIGAGNVLERRGSWSEAASWYRRAMELVDGSDGTSPSRWHARLNLHIALRSAGETGESVEWLESARRIAEEAGDPSAAAPIANAAGQLSMALGEYGSAERHLRRALESAEGARAEAMILLNLGECLLAAGRTLEAAEKARDAERVAVRGGLVSALPEVYRLLGRIAHAEGNPEAFVLFERALQIVRDHELPGIEAATTLQAYARIERDKGDHESADGLLAQARDHLDALGISGFRHRWTESYGHGIDTGESEGKNGP